MAIKDVNIGAAPDDGTGDSLRDAFDTLNKNVRELSSQIMANINQMEALNAVASRVDFVSYFLGAIVASQPMLKAVITRSIQLPANFDGSYAYCDVAPTTAITCPIRTRRGSTVTQIGAISFSAGVSVGMFATSPATTLSAGDVLEVVAPVSADPTFAGPSFGIAAVIPLPTT